MIRGKSCVDETHYDVLSSREGATHDEIRACYRSAVLNTHPDKSRANGLEEEDRFIKVQKAWEILGDSRSRAVYDGELRAVRRDRHVAASEDVGLDEMTVEDAGAGAVDLFYQCRCGDFFCLDSIELGKMGYGVLWNEKKVSLQMGCGGDSLPSSVVIPCGSCSLKIRLFIDPSVCVSVGEYEHGL